MEKFQAKLKKAVKSAHLKVREAAFKAISQVHKGNAKVEKYVVRLLKKLGLSQGKKDVFWDAFMRKHEIIP